MNYDIVENLSFEDINNLYNDVLETGENRFLAESACTIISVTCPNGDKKYFYINRYVGIYSTEGYCLYCETEADCSHLGTLYSFNACDGVYSGVTECVDKFIGGSCSFRLRDG